MHSIFRIWYSSCLMWNLLQYVLQTNAAILWFANLYNSCRGVASLLWKVISRIGKKSKKPPEGKWKTNDLYFVVSHSEFCAISLLKKGEGHEGVSTPIYIDWCWSCCYLCNVCIKNDFVISLFKVNSYTKFINLKWSKIVPSFF